MRKKKHLLKVLVLAVAIGGIGLAGAHASVVDLTITGGAGQWQVYATVAGEDTAGLQGFIVDVVGTAGLTVTASVNEAPMGYDPTVPPYGALFGFHKYRSDGAAGIGVAALQNTSYGDTPDPVLDALVLQGVGMTPGSKMATVWAMPVLLASGTYAGEVGLLTVTVGDGDILVLDDVGASWEGPGNVSYAGEVIPGEVFIPEPITLTLLGVGGLGVLLRRRKK